MGIAFDTLKFVEKLEGGGFSHAQAKAAAEAFADATGEQLATKTDLTALAATMKADLAENKSEILKWMFGQTLLLIGVMMALLRFGH